MSTLPFPVSPVLREVGDYPFLRLDAEKQRVAATGVRLIDFGVGDPREPTDPMIREALAAGIHETMEYPKAVGLPELRDAIAAWVARRYGEASPLGGQPGDALVTIEFVAHPTFRPDGSNLRVDVPLPLETAVLGGKVKVPTLAGPVTMTVPPGANGGRSFRLKGKGLPGSAGKAGDLLVGLKIELPKEPDPELVALMERWRERATASADDSDADG